MREDVIVLRGHHLLCIQGFRGYGYSEQFVAGMWTVLNRLKQAPGTVVGLVDGRDAICKSCPYLVGGECRERGVESEVGNAAQDRRVLRWLGLQAGQQIAWAAILDIIRSTVKPADLSELCRECQWAPLGFCEEGLGALLKDASS